MVAYVVENVEWCWEDLGLFVIPTWV